MANPTETTSAGRGSDLKEQARVVGEDLKKLGSIAKDRATETYGQVRERATQTYGQVREKGNEVGEAVTDHIRQHPWQSVAIAAGVGALLAVLLGRRR